MRRSRTSSRIPNWCMSPLCWW